MVYAEKPQSTTAFAAICRRNTSLALILQCAMSVDAGEALILFSIFFLFCDTVDVLQMAGDRSNRAL
jgi:hypothetical protein